MSAREDLERIEAKVDWCVTALKYLLQGGSVVATDDYDEFDLDEDELTPFSTLDDLRAAAAADEDRLHPRPPPPPANTCPHNRQGLDDRGRLVCNRCGTAMTPGSGVIQDRVGANGGIIRDPNPPAPRPGTETREEQAMAGTRSPSYG